MNIYNAIRVASNRLAPAIISSGQTITYADLLHESNNKANRLRQEGLASRDVVGLLFERTPAFVEWVLAIWQCGAAYCPLNPEWPAQKINTILGTHPFSMIIREGSSSFEKPQLTSMSKHDDLAYIIFTTGSTGQQKGVMMAHDAVLNTLEWTREYFGLSSDSRSLCVSALSFDLSIFDIFGLLQVGGSVIMATQAEVLNPRLLATLIDREKPTLWNSTPIILKLFLDENKTRQFPSIEQVLLSGDWIPINLIETIHRVFPFAKITSLGGATETGIWGNYFPVDNVESSWQSIPYGRPTPNMTYTLDESGELYIGGHSLSSGYWHDPILTEEIFISDPLSGERRFKTGDLARWMKDGNLELLGRTNRVIKYMGHRISLDEIERELLKTPPITWAHVCVVEDQLCAIWSGTPLSYKETLTRLNPSLPHTMTPNAYIFVPKPLLNLNGKPDIDAIHAVIKTYLTTLHASDTLQHAWQSVLGIEYAAPEQDFIELGGDSLKAIAFISRLSKISLNLTLADLYTLKTFGKIQLYLNEQAHS